MQRSIGCGLATSRLDYDQGEITFFVMIANLTAEPLTVRFPTTQRYDFALLTPDGTEIWRWSDGKTFQPTVQDIVVRPSGSLPFMEKLSSIPLPNPSPDHLLLEGLLTCPLLPFVGRLKIAITQLTPR